MPSRRRFWWATSLAIGSVVASGCATSGSLPGLEGLPGKISGQVGRRGVVIAAPHGNSDARTGEMAAELGRRTGFGVVIATGFNLEPDTRERPGRRYQVNRPFEGTPGRPASEDVASEGARQVYRAYEQRVREVARAPLVFYAEIHGNNHRDAVNQIEIATVGVDRDEALRLRDLLKFEFFFARKREFAEEVREEATLMDPEWEQRSFSPEQVREILAEQPMHLAPRVLRPFVDAYRVVADQLALRDPASPLEQKEFVKECLAVGRQRRVRGQIVSAESVSAELFGGGLRVAENRGLLDPDESHEVLGERRRAFALEVSDVSRRIKELAGMGSATIPEQDRSWVTSSV